MCTRTNSLTYAGSELAMFSKASKWKRYVVRSIRRYLKGDLLEVGAGIGSNTTMLAPFFERCSCLEPDSSLFLELKERISTNDLSEKCTALNSTLESSGLRHGAFDAVIYWDVLEHIEDDAHELATAAQFARRGGYVIVIAPAYELLFSAFDRAIGHFRRYNSSSLTILGASALRLVACFYLDSCGILLSLANRVLLKRTCPSRSQIAVWDRLCVPCSMCVDFLVRNSFGKTVVAVWRPV